jgi:hypothetical protein
MSFATAAAIGLGCSGKEVPPVDAGSSHVGGETSTGGSTSTAGTTSTGVGGSSGIQLRWYKTCGYPVCRAPAADAGVPDAGMQCPSVGTVCNDEGLTCGVKSDFNCGVIQVCARQDPTVAPYSCPISSRQYKQGITYLDTADLQKLHEDTLATRLATYTYKSEVADPTTTHLGFIIEDQPASPAVDAMHGRVDLYGYVSMVVASLQVQEREIAELRKELNAARRNAAVCRKTSK